MRLPSQLNNNVAVDINTAAPIEIKTNVAEKRPESTDASPVCCSSSWWWRRAFSATSSKRRILLYAGLISFLLLSLIGGFAVFLLFTSRFSSRSHYNHEDSVAVSFQTSSAAKRRSVGKSSRRNTGHERRVVHDDTSSSSSSIESFSMFDSFLSLRRDEGQQLFNLFPGTGSSSTTNNKRRCSYSVLSRGTDCVDSTGTRCDCSDISREGSGDSNSSSAGCCCPTPAAGNEKKTQNACNGSSSSSHRSGIGCIFDSSVIDAVMEKVMKNIASINNASFNHHQHRGVMEPNTAAVSAALRSDLTGKYLSQKCCNDFAVCVSCCMDPSQLMERTRSFIRSYYSARFKDPSKVFLKLFRTSKMPSEKEQQRRARQQHLGAPSFTEVVEMLSTSPDVSLWFCTEKCRFTSASLYFENQFANPFRFCFG